MGFYEVVVEVGPPHGDLYELVQTATYRVVSSSGEVILTFEGEMSASLSRDSGLWEDPTVDGVLDVTMSPDGGAALVRYADGRTEVVLLPDPPSRPDEVGS